MLEQSGCIAQNLEPKEFSHKIHVTFDPETGSFKGLPPEWSSMLANNDISKEELMASPDKVLKVINFQSTYNTTQETPPAEEIPLPKHTAPPSLEELVNPADPYQLYSGLKKNRRRSIW